MRVLITGAGGFIGSVLCDLLREHGQVNGRPITALARMDRQLPGGEGVHDIQGDLTDAATLGRVQAFGADVLFHLASLPGGASEADYAGGRRVNLDGVVALFEAAAASGTRPVVVYSSTVAVYGTDLPSVVTPTTPLRPPITYGAHKLVGEILLADFTRRGQLDGRSVRLPGIVARPRGKSGLTSAFMSDILHALREGAPFTCPVSPEATAWWMSARRCAHNLLHAAQMQVPAHDTARAWPLPVLRLSIAQIIQTGATLYGADRTGLIGFDPQPSVEAVFGRFPVLEDAQSRSLGLRDDGSAEELVRRALGEIA